MVTTSYLGRQVDPMLEVHTEQKVEFSFSNLQKRQQKDSKTPEQNTHTIWLFDKKNFVQIEIECNQPERSKTERGRDGPTLAFLAVALTDIWLEREDLGTSLFLRVLVRCLGKELKILFPCYSIFSAS
jgi:hypothetical protein